MTITAFMSREFYGVVWEPDHVSISSRSGNGKEAISLKDVMVTKKGSSNRNNQAVNEVPYESFEDMPSLGNVPDDYDWVTGWMNE